MRALFERIWREAGFFELPTQFEAAGAVFCEARACVLPSFGTWTGGVPSLVIDGKNGYTLPSEAGAAPARTDPALTCRHRTGLGVA